MSKVKIGKSEIKIRFFIISFLLDLLVIMKIKINIKSNLWYVNENEWDKLDEIKELIHHIQQK